ncbi:MAG: hypothetical protein ACXVEF_15855 [Polyangiales bacterium]
MRSLIALFAAASLVFTGCAVQNDSADDEGSESAADALALATIYGTWEQQAGGAFYEITFTNEKAESLGGFFKGRKFSAKIDTGARCIKAPCDVATAEVSGIYKISGNKLSLTSYDKPTAAFGRVIGDYTATVSKGVLKLVRRDGSLTTETMTQGIPCGDAVCGTGTYCCNPLMSKCIKMGYMCTL